MCSDRKQIGIRYAGEPLLPFTAYTVTITATDCFRETATGTASFHTGRLSGPWSAKWITDASVPVPEKSSPVPLLFRKRLILSEQPKKVWICATALGIYELSVNGKKQGDRYFAPGFTSYEHQIQYQTYPLDCLTVGANEINVRVDAGWAVGAFTFTRTNKTYADTPSLLLELHLVYADGRKKIIGTDESWSVSRDGKMRFADWYDGEIYDATVDESAIPFHPVDVTKPRSTPALLAEYGAPVRAIKQLKPVAEWTSPSGERIYDFGQNFAGVISAKMRGTAGQRVVFCHAEVLENGELFITEIKRH